MTMIPRVSLLALVLLIGLSDASAARKKDTAPQPPLTPAGEALQAAYSAQLEALKTEILAALPAFDAEKKQTYLAALEAEHEAIANVKAAEKALQKNQKAAGMLKHRQAWIGRATKGVAEAKEQLAAAQALTGAPDAKAKAVAAAEEALAAIQENYDNAASELKKAQAAADLAAPQEAKLTAAYEAAVAAQTAAQDATLKAVQNLDLEPILGRDALDARLAKLQVLVDGTPYGLAVFAQQGAAEAALIEQLLASPELMIQMAIADGAAAGKYGQAMTIYQAIQAASDRAGDGPLQRLALATALEHADPIAQRNPEARTDAPTHVDPVQRYLHFETAYLAGELDAGFPDLSVWEYRMVVNGEEPDEILTWGREMLRNYRPDHITTADERWRYVAAVKTEVRYGSQDNKYDEPELQFFQNILKNGGICGRRAFFGRFILRAFGVPTTARPQPGHAALAHRTTDGWVICLGAGWGKGSTKGRYGKDLNFWDSTQARRQGDVYLQVKRAHWIGDAAGEPRVFGLLDGEPAFWNAIALYTQRSINEEAEAIALAAVGEDIGEANESKEKEVIEQVTISDQDRQIVVGADGVITIPAAACSSPTASTGKIIFMPSNLGGMQLHYSRNGKPQDFSYVVDAPKAGTYALTARVVTPSWKQSLQVVANDDAAPVEMPLPFTVGMWDTTEPVQVTLVQGRNTLTFSRDHEGLKGVSIRDFTLTPLAP